MTGSMHPNRYRDMADVMTAANTSTYSHRFFSPDNIAEWSMRIIDDSVRQDGHGGAFFLTSDRPDPDLPRLYSVRHIDRHGEVRPVDAQFTLFPGGNPATAMDALDFTRLDSLGEARSKLSIAASGAQMVATLRVSEVNSGG